MEPRAIEGLEMNPYIHSLLDGDRGLAQRIQDIVMLEDAIKRARTMKEKSIRALERVKETPPNPNTFRILEAQLLARIDVCEEIIGVVQGSVHDLNEVIAQEAATTKSKETNIEEYMEAKDAVFYLRFVRSRIFYRTRKLTSELSDLEETTDRIGDERQRYEPEPSGPRSISMSHSRARLGTVAIRVIGTDAFETIRHHANDIKRKRKALEDLLDSVEPILKITHEDSWKYSGKHGSYEQCARELVCAINETTTSMERPYRIIEKNEQELAAILERMFKRSRTPMRADKQRAYAQIRVLIRALHDERTNVDTYRSEAYDIRNRLENRLRGKDYEL